MTDRRGDTDVLVIGAGPAGLSAAATAAEQGRRVLVIDGLPRPGGQIWRHRDASSLPRAAREFLRRINDAGVTIASRSTVVDAISPHELVIDFNGRVDRQRARAVVLATGARERILPIPGWTLPGVVGVGGMQALVKSGMNLAGARVVIAGTGPLLFPVATAVRDAGAELLLIGEQATRQAVARFVTALVAKPAALRDAFAYKWRLRGVPYRPGTWISSAHGSDRLREVVVTDRSGSRTIECEWLAHGAGLVPNPDLARLIGCSTDRGAVVVDDAQATSIAGVFAAGECTGIKGDVAAIAEGAIAGASAAGGASAPVPRALQRRRDAGRAFGAKLAEAFTLRSELLQLATADTLVCRCEDVRRGDIDPRWTQRQAKLWTRIGMGECQGAVCGAACEALFGWDTNIVRPPLAAPLCGAWSEALKS